MAGPQLLGMLAAALMGLPLTGIGEPSPADKEPPVIVRKATGNSTRNAGLHTDFYFGSQLESMTSTVAPQDPDAAAYAARRNAYTKAIIGFRLTLMAHTYLFVGVGVAMPDTLLEQWWTQNSGISASQFQDALIMQTEYGFGWDF